MSQLHENEVMRAFKTVNDQLIEPISFIVPRRAEVFQDDIFPPTVGLKPSMSAGDWFGGKDGLPPKISLESVYEGDAPKEVPSEYKPSAPLQSAQSTAPPSPKVAPAPAPTKTEPEQPKAAAVPTALKSPSPSMPDNKASMSSMASKFADKDEVSSSDDEPFEEISKPISRASLNGSSASAAVPRSEPVRNVSPPTPVSKSASPPPAAPASEQEEPTAAATTTTEAIPTALPRASAAEGLKSTLQEIKAMLEAQGKRLVAQGEQIATLTREVELLKAA